MKPSEKRRAPRARHDSVVEILDASGALLIGTARLVDFSKVGLRIAGMLQVERGNVLHVRVRLLREGVLEIIGRVEWIRQQPGNRLYGLSIQTTKKNNRDAA